MRQNQQRRHNAGKIKIIGGNLRSRWIYFPELADLRPTPNRIRETLFNWLAPIIQGARCLDLFAGSGALSFEAISRGAAHSLLFDASSVIVHSLRDNIARLGIGNAEVICASFPYTTHLPHKFDVVFIDPPFHKGYISLALDWLQQVSCLNKKAVIYIESEAESDVLSVPTDWTIVKDKQAGQVRYCLLQTP